MTYFLISENSSNTITKSLGSPICLPSSVSLILLALWGDWGGVRDIIERVNSNRGAEGTYTGDAKRFKAALADFFENFFYWIRDDKECLQ